MRGRLALAIAIQYKILYHPRTTRRRAIIRKSYEFRLIELGITLPSLIGPIGNYVPAVRAGDLLFVSGHGPRGTDEAFLSGKVPTDVGIDEARARARIVGLRLLSSVKAAVGTLDRVERVVKVFGMVNAAPDFTEHPAVIDGCSELFVEVFGDAGKHARSAVGMGSLPKALTVEIEAIFQVTT